MEKTIVDRNVNSRPNKRTEIEDNRENWLGKQVNIIYSTYFNRYILNFFKKSILWRDINGFEIIVIITYVLNSCFEL